MADQSTEEPTARFVILLFDHEQARIVVQGAVPQTKFERLFLDRYELGGERYHCGKDAVVQGVLLSSDKANVVTVPIWTWKVQDGATRWLCQASDDGSPPAFSVLSYSERDLLDQVVRDLGP